ncbi:hypothetical protein ACFWR9_34955 [Streptomyces sp. NPDC058534]|uniref:hypothetical protein n=1 Tax=Streptomyces sp. NPDC058534 TaxID=3346541 RepID=UPI0036655F50
MTNDFMGPPWQMDWVRSARADRDAYPEHVRDLIDAIRAELVTVKDPYFRGIDNLPDLPEGCWVEPGRSTVPDGANVCYFDRGRGWLRYVFVRRSADPQITVEEVFWQ